MDHGALLLATIELCDLLLGKADCTCYFGMDCEILAKVDVFACAELHTTLTDDNTPCIHCLAAKQLYAEALALAIP